MATKQKVKALKITSRSPMGTIRRAGLVIDGTEPTIIAVEALSSAQIAALKGESLLIVQETTVELEDPQSAAA